MKKILILLLVTASCSYSQILNGYGIKIGGTISHQNWDYKNLGFDPHFDPDNKAGFNLGLFVESANISFIRIVGEVNFIQKGIQKEFPISTSESPDPTGETMDWELGLNYLNISLLVKPNINLGILRPYLLIGPKIDMELSKAVETKEDFYDEFEKNRLGLKLGIGSEFTLFKLRLLGEFMYDTDFSNLYTNDNLEVSAYSFDIRIGVYL